MVVVGVRAGGGNSVVSFTFLFRKERGFDGSPRSCYGWEFMPFSHGKGETLGLCDGPGRGGEGLPFGVELVGLVCHEEAVVDAIELDFEVCGAVLGGPEPLVVHRELRGSDRPVGAVKVLENVPYGAGGEARHAVLEILDIDVVDGVDKLVLEVIVDRFEEAEFARGFLMLAFRVSNLSVGGSRCYNRTNAQVERDDEGYAGTEEVFSIRRSENVMNEGRNPAVRLHGSGVLLSCLFGSLVSKLVRSLPSP